MTSLSGRHALVTGGNRGIGEAIVRALAACGANVTLLVRDRQKGEAVARSLGDKHGVVVADLTDHPSVRVACADAERQRGPIDILVNNAGFAESAPFMKTPPELFERMFAIHVLGAVHTTQAVLPGMIDRKGGHVVNMASTAGLHGQAYVTAYVAAKHALVGLTRALALEVAKHGVAVNAVCPGYTDTDLVGDAVARIVAKTGRTPDDALTSILAGAGQQRLVTVSEVADAVVSLCSVSPASTSGQAVVVDGSSGT
jgi:NAD(P)-dependent dehydrogenase (short-subunit alcohol dehydrogenase family)